MNFHFSSVDKIPSPSLFFKLKRLKVEKYSDFVQEKRIQCFHCCWIHFILFCFLYTLLCWALSTYTFGRFHSFIYMVKKEDTLKELKLSMRIRRRFSYQNNKKKKLKWTRVRTFNMWLSSSFRLESREKKWDEMRVHFWGNQIVISGIRWLGWDLWRFHTLITRLVCSVFCSYYFTFISSFRNLI
jgi:hypothetical protein